MARRGPRQQNYKWGVLLGSIAPALALVELLVLPFLVNSPGAMATTFSNRPLGAVVEEAAIIVRGTAGTSYADWGKGEAKGSIFTYTDFVITEALKDSSGAVEVGEKITLKQPGGEKSGVEMSVAATAIFNPGDDVVLTLAQKDKTDQAYMVLNFTAGKYNVIQDNGETYLQNSLGGGEVYDPNRNPDAKVVSYNSRIPLETMRALARGESRPEAQKNQFAPSESEPSNGHKDIHTHVNNIQNAQKLSVTTKQEPESNAVSTNEQVQGNSEGNVVAILVGLVVLIAIGVFGLIVAFKKRGSNEP